MPASMRLTAVVLLVAAASGGGSAAAAADPVTLGGSPPDLLVGERGQLQAFRSDAPDGRSPGIFFRSTSMIGDAGFFLAFPDTSGQQPSLAGKVFGFDGSAGPHLSGDTDSGLQEYALVSQGG